MGYHHYTSEQIEFLRENVAQYSRPELTDMFNKKFNTSLSLSKIKNNLAYRHIRKGTKHTFTAEQIEFLRDNAAGRRAPELTDMFNEQFGMNLRHDQIHSALRYRKIRSGLGRYYFPTSMSVGTESIHGECTYVKVAEPCEWRRKHVLVWEAANGSIPKNHAIIFADGNKQNFDLNNLLLVPYRQMAILNMKRLRFSDPELTKTGIMIADLLLKASDLRKKGVNQ